MAAKHVALVKLTRPRLHAAASRERLFAVLDGFRDHPGVWIAGPPGAGKTTLAATWIETRSLPGIWYQLDSGDSDPATFFYYMQQAAEAAGAKCKVPLPLLTPEYLADIPGFTRRWFRELFVRLPEGAVIALDNYHELNADSPLHKALAVACEELPESSQLIAMSWERAPPAYSRLSVTQRLAEVDWEDLKLTEVEAADIAGGNEGISSEQAIEINRACEGWAAGFTLMRERLKRTGLINRIELPGSMQQVFDYFVGQAFTDASPENRDALVKMAIFPRFTETMARQFTGYAKIGELLEWLYRRHLFIDRRYGEEVTYQYHTLFRAFLKDQAKRQYNEKQIAELAQRAAQMLEKQDQEAAIGLWLEANDKSNAATLILSRAHAVLAAGRGQTLRNWIAILGTPWLGQQPWLRYWEGMSLIGVDLVRARHAFEQAVGDFDRRGDDAGRVAAACAVLEVLVLQYGDLHPGRAWVAVVENALPHVTHFPSREIEARALAGAVLFLLWHLADKPLLGRCARALMDRLAEPMEPNQKVVAGCYLLEYFGMTGFREESRRVIALVEPALSDSASTELSRALWFSRTAVQWVFAGDPEGAERIFLEGEALVERNGFDFLRVTLLRRRADFELDRWNVNAAVAIQGELRARYADGDWLLSLWSAPLEAKVAMLKGRMVEAEGHARRGYEFSRVNGLMMFALYNGLLLAWAMIEQTRYEDAEKILEEIRLFLPADTYPTLGEHEVRLIRVCCDALQGKTSSWRRRLEDELAGQRRLGCLNPLPIVPMGTRKVCEIALAEDLERDYVRNIVKTWNIPPSSPEIPNWPWAIRLRMLGALAVDIDEAPLTFTGKAPRKPLELLQAIVAFGAKGVSAETLSNALWPDSEADAADTSLRVTLSRLRKLLKNEEAIVFSEGKIGLDERLCWTDVGSLERVFAQIEALQSGPAAEGAETLAARLLDLYHGGFLEKEREQPWMLPLRETLRRRFIGAVGTVGERLEKNGTPERALALYERALAQDKVAEPIYRCVMSAHLALGQKAEALNAYRHCRDMLSIVLGVRPSAETEALADRARR